MLPTTRRALIHPMDLPMELWGLVLTKLPHDDALSRYRASLVCKAWREAERACDRCVELKLTSQDMHSRLRALAAWGHTRVGAVAATLTATSNEPSVEAGLLSLASLGAMPTLRSLELSLDLPVAYVTLAACTGLTALRVAVPHIASLEYYLDDDDAVPLQDILDMFEPEVAVQASSRFGAFMALPCQLEPGLTPLSRLQSLDVDGLVPPRGDIRVMGIKLPVQTTLPWLTCLTQLTRLKARVYSVNEGAWSLPRLKELHVCGGYQREVIDMGEDIGMHEDRLGLECRSLERIGSQLTKLILESCEIQGNTLVLRPGVKELCVLKCSTWKSRTKVSCPGLCRLCVVINTDDEEFSVAWGAEEYKRMTFSVTFLPMPQLTELVLDFGDIKRVWGGTKDRRIKCCRRWGIALPEARASGTSHFS